MCWCCRPLGRHGCLSRSCPARPCCVDARSAPDLPTLPYPLVNLPILRTAEVFHRRQQIPDLPRPLRPVRVFLRPQPVVGDRAAQPACEAVTPQRLREPVVPHRRHPIPTRPGHVSRVQLRPRTPVLIAEMAAVLNEVDYRRHDPRRPNRLRCGRDAHVVIAAVSANLCLHPGSLTHPETFRLPHRDSSGTVPAQSFPSSNTTRTRSTGTWKHYL